MSNGSLTVATCQFAVSADVKRNARAVLVFLEKAAQAQADIVHFSECALSGYAGSDFPSFAGYNWDLLKEETLRIMETARRLGVWVVLGSTHRLTEPHKPHNCLYLINPQGRIEDRYDKRFGMPRDLEYYTPGNRFVRFVLNGVTCSMLICFDLRFPELYRELYKLGVRCVFQSFYNARQEGPSVHRHIMRQTMQCHAATNYFWVSMSNSSAYYSPYSSCLIYPDGVVAAQLRPNRPDMLVGTVDARMEFYDPMRDFRDLAIAGTLTNGPGLLDDPRSLNRQEL